MASMLFCNSSKPNSDDQESNDDEEAECDGDKDQQDGDVNLGQVGQGQGYECRGHCKPSGSECELSIECVICNE